MVSLVAGLLLLAWAIRDATSWHWLVCGLLAPFVIGAGLAAYVGLAMLDRWVWSAL